MMIPLWLIIVLGIFLVVWYVLSPKNCKYSKTCKYFKPTSLLCAKDVLAKERCELYNTLELNQKGEENE